MNEWVKSIKRKGLGEAIQEVNENLKSPETAPSDKRFTGRNQQLGLRVKPEFTKKLKMLAAEENVVLVEILEKALECYEQKKLKN